MNPVYIDSYFITREKPFVMCLC